MTIQQILPHLDGVETVVLDLDGTIYPGRAFIRRIIVGEVRWLHYLVAERLTRRAIKGRVFPSGEAFYQEFFRRMALCRLFSAEQARTWFFGHYMPLMARILRAKYKEQEWVRPLLAECRRRGIRVGVLSDYGYVESKLEALGLDLALFDAVDSAADLGALKPAAEAGLRFLAQMKARPETALFIGDHYKSEGRLAEKLNAKYLLV